MLVRPVYSREDTAKVAQILRDERIDVLHLHNPYPLISPQVVRVRAAYVSDADIMAMAEVEGKNLSVHDPIGVDAASAIADVTSAAPQAAAVQASQARASVVASKTEAEKTAERERRMNELLG